MIRNRSRVGRSRMSGLTLIEMMIAMVLGLMVLGAAIAIFASNRQAYRTAENVGRLQENVRTAFELMALDIREAGGNACSRGLPTANVLNSATANWYSDWSSPIQGFDNTAAFSGVAFGTAAARRVNNTDAIEIKSTGSEGVTVASANPSSARIELNTANHGLSSGDLAIICDNRQAAVFQVTNASPGTNTNLIHNAGGGVTPGNCTKSLGLPVNCASGVDYAFGANSTIAKLHATAWFIGFNGRGGRSLYQLAPPSGSAVPVANEVAEGVNDMQITYLATGNPLYRNASAITDWNAVTAVRVRLVVATPDAIGTDGQPVTREVSHVVMLRNRNE